jgi:hypothetical protein
MTLLAESLFSTEAHNKRAHDAAAEFAKTYWREPREIEAYDYDADTFTLVDGAAEYQVQLVVGVRFESVDTFQITRKES